MAAVVVAALVIALVAVVGTGFLPGAATPPDEPAPATAATGAATAAPPSAAQPAVPPSVPASTSPSVPPSEATPAPSHDPSAVYGPPAPLVSSGLRLPASLAAELKRTLNGARKRYAMPGVSAAILWPDGRLWMGAAGYADLDAERPVNAETEFSIGSITKTFTAALILQLAEEGVLSLDDPVSKWVAELPAQATTPRPSATPASSAGPGAPDASPAAATPRATARPALPISLPPDITIRHLLDHTSGLDDFFGSGPLENAMRRPKTRAWKPLEVLRYAGTPRRSPGTAWAYSNTNYVLLGLIAERATGMSLADLYRTRLMGPGGLRSTYLQGYEKPVGPISHGYDFYSMAPTAAPIDWSDGTSVMPFTAVATAAWAAGGLASTPSDLARWARTLYGGFLLSEDSLRQMLDVSDSVRLKAETPYGLGAQRLKLGMHDTVGHSGRLGGYRSAMRYVPNRGVAIVVLSNQDRWSPDLIVRDLLDVALGFATRPPDGTAPAEVGGPRESL